VVLGGMHRKADEESRSSAAADEDNAARRPPSAAGGKVFPLRDTRACQPPEHVVDLAFGAVQAP